MKVLFITNKLPFPDNDGRKNILMQYVRTIKKFDNNVEVLNAAFIDKEEYLEKQPNEISSVTKLDQPKIIEKLFNLLMYTFLLRKWPLQVSMYYSRKTHRKVSNLVKEVKPDFIVYDMVRVAPYLVKGFSGQTIMNYDDLLSLRYSRQLEHIHYIPTILGGIASYFPMYIQKLISSKSLQKSILKFESRLLNKYEKQVGWSFDKLVFTSPKEAKEFSEIINDRACLGIPMAYDTDKTKIRSKYQENQIVFVGKMDIPHNVAAVLYFCEKIWPIVKRANSSLEFHIIGKNPIKSVLELENKYEGVKVVGPVADIEESIKNSAVFVAPLVFGTGIKTKVIEALSYGVPVVTTSIGAEGIDFKNGHHMYVSDIEGEFANHIISLTKSEKLNESFSINGKELVHHEFSKQSMNNKWLTLLGKS